MAYTATTETFHNIIGEMKRQGLKASLEGGGAAPLYIEVSVSDGSFISFGDGNKTWSGEVYWDKGFLNEGNPQDSLSTNVSTESINIGEIVEGFLETFDSFIPPCMKG